MTSASLRWVLIFSLVTLVSLEPHQRSGLRIVHKLVGGHINANRDDDVELMTSGAGEGQPKTKKTSSDEKKTLSQQVADGKYALIQNEIFSKPVKRPGIISYKENPEVPKDNVNNLGGLNKSDIWLSENHLLVIKGGFYPDHNQDNKDVSWTPIDDFNAPERQVKIPSHPKVPPPFPVQLEEGGPIVLFLGPNVTKTLNGTFAEGIRPVYPENNEVPGGEGGPGKEGPPGGKHPPYPFTGETPFPIPPFPPPGGLDIYVKEKPKEGIGSVNNRTAGPYLPPAFIPPDNFTYDEDDPSIYYPPPYSFYYPKDNSSDVPPGPLVPGIVLPPPPNFFGALEENKEKAKTTTTTTTTTTTPKPRTSTTVKHKATKTKIYFYPSPNTTITPTVRKKPSTTETTSRKKYPTITILKPVSRTTTTTKQPIRPHHPFKVYGPPTTTSSETPKVVVTSTKIPLKAYYTTTHLEPIPVTERPKATYEVQNVEVNIQNISPQPITTTTQSPIRYYFYDENVINTTPLPPKAKEENYYVPKEILISQQPQPPNIRYFYVGEQDYPIRSQPSVNIRKPPKQQNSFSVHIARLKQEIENYQTVNNNDNRPNNYYGNPKPVYHYEFQAAGYRPQNYETRYVQPKRPVPHYSVEIQEAVEVTPPTPVYEATQEGYYLDSVTENPAKSHEVQRVTQHRTPKPISQYSFEVTQNPLYAQYYTKQDEKYIDDATKEYFTVFGKRIPISTTPIPIQRHKYYQRPQETIKSNNPTLEGDTYINYLPQRPRFNPHSEFILQPVSPERNYHRQVQQTERPIVTYKLPGDEGTHFYFLTPQLAQKREQNASFYFSNAKNRKR